MNREEVIEYTRRDAELFIDLMDNPRPPNDALLKAFERYKGRILTENTGHSDLKGS